jgi:hypothetical protein
MFKTVSTRDPGRCPDEVVEVVERVIGHFRRRYPVLDVDGCDHLVSGRMGIAARLNTLPVWCCDSKPLRLSYRTVSNRSGDGCRASSIRGAHALVLGCL